MPRTFLCTAGTSIATRCPSLNNYQRRASDWDEDSSPLRAEIVQRLQDLDLASERDRVAASAELNILHRLGVSPGDQVVLLATDTADGRCCAEMLKQVLTKHFNVNEVMIERIGGLQVHDAEKLRRTGLANFTRRLIHYLEDPQRRYGGGFVLCPNGGFKGVVPFLTVLGMLYRAPVVYVFEHSDALIRLPPLPLSFASDLLDRALPALHWAAAENTFNPAQFFNRIPGFQESEQEWFEGFLELALDSDSQPLASLSPLAEALVKREGGATPLIRISTLAKEELESCSGHERKVLLDFLRKLASPLWRSQQGDTKYNSDLIFYPRGHQSWRFAGFEEGRVFHLCWFARHDEYEQLLPSPERQKAAFPSECFSDYQVPADNLEAYPKESPPEPSDEILSQEDLVIKWKEAHACAKKFQARCSDLEKDKSKLSDSLVKTQRRLEQTEDALKTEKQGLESLRQEKEHIENRLKTLEEDARHLSEENARLEQSLAAEQASSARNAGEISELQAQLQRLQTELSHLKQPWWRRLWPWKRM